MKLYYFPKSTYSHKALLAMYEKQATFTPVILYPGDPTDRATLRELTPISKVPVLVLDSGWKIPESTTIVEYVDAHVRGARLIPEDIDLARQTRFHDRLADLYINESYNTIVRDSDPARVASARERLDTILTGLDRHLENRTWVMGDAFTLADCSLIPPLLEYAGAHSYARFERVTAYVERARKRPSVARVLADRAAYVAKAAS